MFVVLDAVADAFMSVSVLVAALFVLFGVLRVRWGARFESLITRRERTGPVLAVVATLPPGCIGVLAVSRLYVAGAVSYGTVIAALVSTMGDSAWLLLAEDPLFTLYLKLGFATFGCITGLVVDRLRIRPSEKGLLARRTAALAAIGSGSGGPVTSVCAGPPAGSTGAAQRSRQDRHRATPSILTTLFLVCLAVGLLVSLPVRLQLMSEEATELPARILGVLGTIVAVVIVLASRGRLGCGEEENSVEQSMSEVFRNCSREAAFVTVWVSSIFVLWELAAPHLNLEGGAIPLGGVVGIAIAAGAGLIPACGVEILVSTLFVTGAIPAPALIAYLVSQDGNGFIPIAARQPQAALHGTVLTTLLALAAGLVVLAFS